MLEDRWKEGDLFVTGSYRTGKSYLLNRLKKFPVYNNYNKTRRDVYELVIIGNDSPDWGRKFGKSIEVLERLANSPPNSPQRLIRDDPNSGMARLDMEIVDIPTPDIHNCPWNVSKKYKTEAKQKSPTSEETVGCRNDREQYSCVNSSQCWESPERIVWLGPCGSTYLFCDQQKNVLCDWLIEIVPLLRDQSNARRILIVGNIRAGKSSFMNSLLTVASRHCKCTGGIDVNSGRSNLALKFKLGLTERKVVFYYQAQRIVKHAVLLTTPVSGIFDEEADDTGLDKCLQNRKLILEQIDLQLEAEYRQRLAEVHDTVRRRLALQHLHDAYSTLVWDCGGLYDFYWSHQICHWRMLADFLTIKHPLVDKWFRRMKTKELIDSWSKSTPEIFRIPWNSGPLVILKETFYDILKQSSDGDINFPLVQIRPVDTGKSSKNVLNASVLCERINSWLKCTEEFNIDKDCFIHLLPCKEEQISMSSDEDRNFLVQRVNTVDTGISFSHWTETVSKDIAIILSELTFAKRISLEDCLLKCTEENNIDKDCFIHILSCKKEQISKVALKKCLIVDESAWNEELEHSTNHGKTLRFRGKASEDLRLSLFASTLNIEVEEILKRQEEIKNKRKEGKKEGNEITEEIQKDRTEEKQNEGTEEKQTEMQEKIKNEINEEKQNEIKGEIRNERKEEIRNERKEEIRNERKEEIQKTLQCYELQSEDYLTFYNFDNTASRNVQRIKELHHKPDCSPRTSTICSKRSSFILDCVLSCFSRSKMPGEGSWIIKIFISVMLLSYICSTEARDNISSQADQYHFGTGLRVEAFDGALVQSSKVWDLVAEIRGRHSGLLDVEIFSDLLDSYELLERGYEIGWLPLKIKGEVHTRELDKEGQLLEVQCKKGQFLSKGLTKFEANGNVTVAKKCCVCIFDPYRDRKSQEMSHKNTTVKMLMEVEFGPYAVWSFHEDGLQENCSDEENIEHTFSIQLENICTGTVYVFNKTKKINNCDFKEVYESIALELIYIAVIVAVVVILFLKEYGKRYEKSGEIVLALMVLSVSIYIWWRFRATKMNKDDDEDIITTEQTVYERPESVQMLWSLLGMAVRYRRTDSSYKGHTTRHELKFCYKSFDIHIELMIERNEELNRNENSEEIYDNSLHDFNASMSDADEQKIRSTHQIEIFWHHFADISSNLDARNISLGDNETGSDEDNTYESDYEETETVTETVSKYFPTTVSSLTLFFTTFILAVLCTVYTNREVKFTQLEPQGIPDVQELNAIISEETSAHACLRCEVQLNQLEPQLPDVQELNAIISEETSAHACLQCEGKYSVPFPEFFICVQEKQKAVTPNTTENENHLQNLTEELQNDLGEESEDPEPLKALDDDTDIHYSDRRKGYIPSNDEDIIFESLVHANTEEEFFEEFEQNTVKKDDENDLPEPRPEGILPDPSNRHSNEANEGQDASYAEGCSSRTHYIIDVEEQENGHIDKSVVIPTCEIPSSFGASLPLDDTSTCMSSATSSERVPEKLKLRMQVLPVSPKLSKRNPDENIKKGTFSKPQNNDTFLNLKYKVKGESSAKKNVDCTLKENELEQILYLRGITWLPINELPAPKIDLDITVGFGEEFEPLMAIIDMIANGTPPTPHISMRYELLRFCTLRSYPKDNKPFLIKLAAAGFYYASDGDGVVCYCCGVRRYNWVSEDNPMKIHQRINPNCKYLKKNEEVNVPVKYFGPFSEKIYFIENIPEARERTEQSEDVNNDWAPERSRSPTTAPPNRQGERANSLGINTALPKHTQYATKTAREASYSGWPDTASHDPKVLADAGFFYAGFGDCVRCFYCGIGLRHWTQDDDPWIEHARWSKNCVFIKQKKGEEFVNLVQLAVQYSQDNEAQVNVGAGNQLPGQEIEKIMLSDAAQSVLEMGYQPRIIKKAVEQILRQNVDTKITAQMLMEKVLEIEEAENPSQPAPAPAPAPKKAPAAPLKTKANSQTVESNVLKTVEGAQGGAKLQATGKTPPEGKEKEDKDKDKHESEEAGEAASQDPKAIKAENEQLKEQTLCKVCLDNTVCIVFLPCGHLVTCADCAPAMRKCPICRALVKGTVRTYMS